MARLFSSLALFCRVQAFPCLLLCYLLFILLGGLVFWVVEGPVEQQLRVEVEELRRSFLQENPCVRGGRLVELLDRALSAHQRDVAVLQADPWDRGYDFTSSLYFVIVTLTTMGYLLGGLVVIITLKDTLLQDPRVCAVIRLFCGPQYAELEGLHLNELTLSEELCEEEEAQYSQSICTVSSTHL